MLRYVRGIQRSFLCSFIRGGCLFWVADCIYEADTVWELKEKQMKSLRTIVTLIETLSR